MDHTQPLLVSKPSRRNRRAGITGPILLIPELCRETGSKIEIIPLMMIEYLSIQELPIRCVTISI